MSPAAPGRRGGNRPVLRPHDEALAAELVAAATHALEAGGPSALSVRSLAGATGTTTQAIYSLFGGKAGLLDAVLAEGYAALAAQLAAVEPDRDPVQALVDLAGAYRAWALSHPALYGAMLAPGGRGVEGGGLRSDRDGSRVRADGRQASAVLAASREAMLGPLREQSARIVDEDRVHAPGSDAARERAEAIARGIRAAVHGWVELEAREGGNGERTGDPGQDGDGAGGDEQGAEHGGAGGDSSGCRRALTHADARFTEYAEAMARGLAARVS